jgi:phosphopantetheinyl transferase
MNEQLRGWADLWLLDEASIGQAALDYQVDDILSASERAQHERLPHPDGRFRYLGGRMLMRYVLAAYTGVPPANLEFGVGAYDRPELAPNPDQLCFNLAHTSGLIGFLATRNRLCGIDFERRPARPELAEAVVRFLAPRERAHLQALEEEEADITLQYRVVKGAYLRALGAGLSRSPDGFTVRGLGSTGIGVEDRQAPEQAPEQAWQFEWHQLTAEHAVGLAIAGDRLAPGRIPIRILDFTTFLRAVFPAVGVAPGAHIEPTSNSRATIRSWPNRKEQDDR